MPGDKIKQLPCHETHQFHEECLDNFLKHNEATPQFKLCPLCRRKIDENAIVKKTVGQPKPATDLKVEDAFKDN